MQRLYRVLTYLLLGALLSAALTGCETAPTVDQSKPGVASVAVVQPAARSEDQVQYEAVLAEAKAALKKAVAVNNVWRDTEKLIADAEKSAEVKDYTKAIKLATAAKNQGELAYQQAQAGKNAGHPSYLK